ncbi:hypothetical protein [Marinospirillum minutulum]|nr:hypothetical protein [Marinospirillum minutulum]
MQEPKTYLEAQEGRHTEMLSQLKWRRELVAWLDAYVSDALD